MKNHHLLQLLLFAVIVFLSVFPLDLKACSSFKLQKGNELLYGHNLNEGGLDVPGLVFVNKRGIFKTGRTWSEMIKKDQSKPSSFRWISQYGSVTFNVFGKDLPDGGMNETGLYIWEMNEAADYPQNDSLPKLMHMNWMQYVLDNCSTLEEALASASQFQIDGWTWHYFIADGKGNCATLNFTKGKVVIRKGADMPVPAYFNTPYDREMEVAKYYKGFGGTYEVDMKDPEVPRFVRFAQLLNEYSPDQNAAEYGRNMLIKLKVWEVPDWSVLFDVKNQNVYFKTSVNTEWKQFSLASLDYSNATPTLMLNMNVKAGGDVGKQLHPYTTKEMTEFIKAIPLPAEFYGMGGLNHEEFITRFATHSDRAALPSTQSFVGTWKSEPIKDRMNWEMKLWTVKDAVMGEITNSDGYAKQTRLENIHMSGNILIFTFKSLENKKMYEVQAPIQGNTMIMNLYDTTDYYGDRKLIKQ